MTYPSLAPPPTLGSMPNEIKTTNLSAIRDALIPAVIQACNRERGDCIGISVEIDYGSDCIVLIINGVKTLLVTRSEIEDKTYLEFVSGRILSAIEQPLLKEIHAGEITAWRAWRWTGQHLQSTAMDTIWLPHEIVTAGIGCEGLGSVNGGYGIHCWHNKEDARKYSSIQATCSNIVLGQIEIWGEVIEHEAGYRAEYANIISIDEAIGQDFWPWQLKAIRELYLQ